MNDDQYILELQKELKSLWSKRKMTQEEIERSDEIQKELKELTKKRDNDLKKILKQS